jgi:SAM-dependent methyltransferase
MEDQVYSAMYELEDRHWWFRGRRAMIWALLRRHGVQSPLRLLDAGCGTGRHLVEYRVLGEAHGIDPSPAAVGSCRQRGLRNVTEAPIEQLPFADACFELVLATDVLEHLDDDALALAELRRVASPGAALVVTVPALMWLWSDEDVRLHHRRRYRRPKLVARMRAAGWEPRVATYYNTLLLPPIALARKARRAVVPAEGSRPELERSSGLLSSPLYLPLRLEAALVERGVRLPVGVSIGVVATASA